jgi:hypothetical protein
MCLAVTLFAGAIPARAQAPTPGEIVDRAIRAHGGDERLVGLTGFVIRYRSEFTDGVATSQDLSVSLPNQSRSISTLSSGGKSRTTTLVVAGDEGWSRSNDMTLPYPQPFLANYKKFTLPFLGPRDILRLRARQKNPACQFASTGEATIDGRAAVGLKMNLNGGSQQVWYFDKESGLLLREESPTANFEGEDTVTATSYADYQTFDGFPLARKVTNERDGKPYFTRELIDFKAASPDPAAFAKP